MDSISIEGNTIRVKNLIAVGADRMAEEFTQALPCVIYECNPSLELTFVSANIYELLGIDAKDLLGKRLLWEKGIAPEDKGLLSWKLDELKRLQSVFLHHRLMDQQGRRIWVAHGLKQVNSQGGERIQGCLLRVQNDWKIHELCQSAVDRFVHKIGNYFQILNLVVNSLSKALPNSRETEVLQSAIESATDLVRIFSEYNQVPSSWERIDVGQLFNGMLIRFQPGFVEKGVSLEERVESSVQSVSLSGDPFLIELTLGHILQNSLEATEKGGRVQLLARTESLANGWAWVKMSILDSGLGIGTENLEQALVPFFTTKQGHAGLGLSMACRFVEMHSGHLSLRSEEGKGTEVEIQLPAAKTENVPSS